MLVDFSTTSQNREKEEGKGEIQHLLIIIINIDKTSFHADLILFLDFNFVFFAVSVQ